MMDRITAKQASEKWGLSLRTVQDLCSKGRIDGAERWGRAWMIPADAKKPSDGRLKKAAPAQDSTPFIEMPVQTPYILMSGLYSTPGSGADCIEKLSDNPYTAAIFESWLLFTQGDYDKAADIARPLLNVKADFYGTMNVGTLLTACALWKNDMSLWRMGREHIANAECADDYDRKIRDLWLGITDADVLTNIKHLNWYYWGEFDKLPEDSLPAVWFFYAKHMHKIARNIARGHSDVPDVQGLGLVRMYPYIAEPLVAQVNRAGSLVAELCIRLLCTDAYLNLGLRDSAVRHLDIALKLALPDKLYGVLSEFRGFFSSLMDERLSLLDPDAAMAVKKLYRESISNLNSMKNRSILNNLTDREQEIAQLAALGMSNNEIAQRLHISTHTVKSIISMIMNKTGATKRSDFGTYVL